MCLQAGEEVIDKNEAPEGVIEDYLRELGIIKEGEG